MSSAISSSRPARWRWLIVAGGLVLLGLAVVFSSRLTGLLNIADGPATGEKSAHDHAGQEHEPDDEHAADMVELSEAARRTIGIQVKTAKLRPFVRTISVPGIVVERPGRSTIQVTAPMTGVITRIVPTEGEAITPGQVLFEMRLLHEEVVQAQADLLRTAEELDVVGREIARLEKAVVQSAIPGKTVLERKYEQQRQQAIMHSQRQTMLLHGFSESQVEEILKTRKLVQFLTVRAPEAAEPKEDDASAFQQVQSLKVVQGQYVTSGDTLAILADHRQLFIEGNAFERDLGEIQRAHAAGEKISATFEAEGNRSEPIPDLQLLYTASQLDETERTLHFYVGLPNTIAHDAELPGGRRYVAWNYRPGQRAQLQVPVETWADRIVLPAEAVAQDGAETYAFVVHGTHFDRRTVEVEYKDPAWVVLAKGGIQPGDRVVMAGAKQLWLALKNKSGGAIDPHAGHSH